MFIFFLHNFMQVLPSNLYMPYVPKDCHHYFRNHEFYPVLERLFPRNNLNQKKTLRKIPLKEKLIPLKGDFPFISFSSKTDWDELLIFFSPRNIYYMPFTGLALFQVLKFFFFFFSFLMMAE